MEDDNVKKDRRLKLLEEMGYTLSLNTNYGPIRVQPEWAYFELRDLRRKRIVEGPKIDGKPVCPNCSIFLKVVVVRFPLLDCDQYDDVAELDYEDNYLAEDIYYCPQCEQEPNTGYPISEGQLYNRPH